MSNLSFLSKLLEKCVLVRFNNHCKENNLMPSHQLAYREHHSCETTLVRLTNDLLWSMEKQWVTALVAIDLSVAFNTVDHRVLLKVLQQNFGVNGKALNWIDTYLRPRGFKVNIGKEYSKYIPMDFSGPQGSILGPVLFSAYISTLRLEVPGSIDLIGFADDHVLKKDFLASKGNEEDNTIYQLQNCCTKVKNWMDHNRLKMNSDKTEFILIGSKQQLQKCYTKQININSENIIMSETIKYLGAWIDSNLSFKKHITERCKNAMWNVHRLKHIRKFLDQETCHTLVCGLVLAHLDYANAILADRPNVEIAKMQRVQNIAAKLVMGANSYSSPTECRIKLHWLPVRAWIKYKILLLVYKCVQGTAPTYLQELININTYSRVGLCSSNDGCKLQIPRVNRETFANRSFKVVGPRWWNSLPIDI